MPLHPYQKNRNYFYGDVYNSSLFYRFQNILSFQNIYVDIHTRVQTESIDICIYVVM